MQIEDQMDKHRAAMKPVQINALDRAIAAAKARLSGETNADRYARQIAEGGDLDQIATEMDRDETLSDGDVETLFGMIEQQRAVALP
ncbi:MAG: hypothetical protein OEU92_29985, partial [Alphaproteobacteria bacterium]|nr:hypothetical protein [Alphaproteobacteria bacterium]